jgi:hypothetical protein
MMLVAGPTLDFYYEGLVLVISFAAFAFRLPTRHLAWECAFLLALYFLLAAYHLSTGGAGSSGNPQFDAVLLNNTVFLLTFVTLALSVSVSLHRSDG